MSTKTCVTGNNLIFHKALGTPEYKLQRLIFTIDISGLLLDTQEQSRKVHVNVDISGSLLDTHVQTTKMHFYN